MIVIISPLFEKKIAGVDGCFDCDGSDNGF